MKKLIVVPVVFLMLVFCNATVSQAQGITLGFDPFSQEVLVGDPANVDLVISGLGDGVAPSLSVFDLDISFDPSILDFSSVSFGLFLGDPFWYEAVTDVLPPGALRPDNTLVPAGTVNIYELSLLDANSTSGPFFIPPYLDDQPSSFTLATLTFDTLALGTSPLNISSVWALGDANGDPLTYSLESGSISAVPEPATLLLLGSGLVGLGYLRKRKTSKVS